MIILRRPVCGGAVEPAPERRDGFLALGRPGQRTFFLAELVAQPLAAGEPKTPTTKITFGLHSTVLRAWKTASSTPLGPNRTRLRRHSESIEGGASNHFHRVAKKFAI